jgi:N-succinyl-L-ornithine transcarbamylase
MRHFLSLRDYTPAEIQQLVKRAHSLKQGADTDVLRGKTLGMIFLNPSLRTRVSFEQAIKKYGGSAIALSPGKDTWSMETEDGTVMNSDKVEHIKDAARVLSRYCDVLGLRSFAALKDVTEDLAEKPLRQFARYATVPVVSLESATEHPCQAVADMLTITEHCADLQKKQFVLSWAPHVKALPFAVPASALIAASYLGMQVTVTHPEGYELPSSVLEGIPNLTVTADQKSALKKADVVYAKSWSPPALYNDPAKLQASFEKNRGWMFDNSALSAEARFMHCLPVRRNVEVCDAVLDGKNSLIIDQAENRLWAQAAILEFILK